LKRKFKIILEFCTVILKASLHVNVRGLCREAPAYTNLGF